MATGLVCLVFDAADPSVLAEFWSAALGWPITADEPDGGVVIAPPDDDPSQRGQVPLEFLPSREPKQTKNRIHLDLATKSSEHQAELVERLEQLGARRVDIGQGSDVTWVVMADPEGNELCLVSHAGSVGADPASAFGDLAPVAAIVLDAQKPAALAPFWAEAIGWPILGDDGVHVWLRDTNANGPYLDIRQNADRKVGKLRVHLDVAPTPQDSHPNAVERLKHLGATPVDIGQGDVGWEVLADPEGNELCVLRRR